MNEYIKKMDKKLENFKYITEYLFKGLDKIDEKLSSCSICDKSCC